MVCDQIWQKLASTHTMARLTFQFLHQWTNNPYVYHCQWFPSLLFLGLVSWACLTCFSAWVDFKWQWCDWTHPWLVRELGHQIGYYLWYLKLKWDHLAVFNLYAWKSLPLCGSLCNHLWYRCKNYLKCQAIYWIQLAVLCRVGQLKDIV